MLKGIETLLIKERIDPPQRLNDLMPARPVGGLLKGIETSYVYCQLIGECNVE